MILWEGERRGGEGGKGRGRKEGGEEGRWMGEEGRG